MNPIRLSDDHLIEELVLGIAEHLPDEIGGEPVEPLPDFAVHTITAGPNKYTAITFMVGDRMIELAMRIRQRSPRGVGR